MENFFLFSAILAYLALCEAASLSPARCVTPLVIPLSPLAIMLCGISADQFICYLGGES